MNNLYFNQTHITNNSTSVASRASECIDVYAADVLFMSIILGAVCFEYMILTVMGMLGTYITDQAFWSHAGSLIGDTNPIMMYKCLAVVYGIPHEIFIKVWLFIGMSYLVVFGWLIALIFQYIIQFLLDFYDGFFGVDRDEWL